MASGTGNATPYKQVVTGLSDNGFVAVWDTYGERLHAQMFGADGAKKGEEIDVGGPGSSLGFDFDAGALPSGGFVLAWVHNSVGEMPNNARGFVQVQAFDQTGRAMTAPLSASSVLGQSLSDPRIAVLPDGSFYVSWSHLEPDGTHSTDTRVEGRLFHLDAADKLDGGAGNDLAIIDQGLTSADIVFDLSNPSMQQTLPDGTTIVNVERIDFTAGAGDDTITGGALTDTIFGGLGFDTLTGGTGDDILEGGGNSDMLHGGTGSDAASYAHSTSGVRVDLTAPTSNAGDAAGDSFDSIENLIGSRHNDRLAGNSGSNIIEGGAGADTLIGGGFPWT